MVQVRKERNKTINTARARASVGGRVDEDGGVKKSKQPFHFPHRRRQ